MEMVHRDAVLTKYCDLDLMGMLAPSEEKIIRPEMVREFLPARLVALAEAEADTGRLAGLVFSVRIGALTADEIEFTGELADVLYVLAQTSDEARRNVPPPDAVAAAGTLRTTVLGVFVALALHAKRRLIERGAIEQCQQMIRFTLSDFLGRDPRAGLPEVFVS